MALEPVIEADDMTTLQFFYYQLKFQCANRPVSKREMAHVASVLATYAATSPSNRQTLPPLADLSEFYSQFFFKPEIQVEPVLLEIAGAQSLLLAGFFREQMRRRHNVEWHDRIGQFFYDRASRYSPHPEKQDLFGRISEHFPFWTTICSGLHKSLWQNRYLLRLS
jgi:hypothetical protein